MCTTTLYRKSDGFQIIMNRDERLDRPEETPPQELRPGIFGPCDPVSGGTWIAHNADGYWGCLLNGYYETEQPKGRKSRGTILLDFLSKQDPFDSVREFDASPYSSFRLVLGSPTQAKLYIWDGCTFSHQDFYASYKDRAYFISSSSFRQSEVIAHRKALFLNAMKEKGEDLQGRLDFHTTQDNAEIDPLMLRSYSRTKSITIMNIGKANSNFDYASIPESFDYSMDAIHKQITIPFTARANQSQLGFDVHKQKSLVEC